MNARCESYTGGRTCLNLDPSTDPGRCFRFWCSRPRPAAFFNDILLLFVVQSTALAIKKNKLLT